MTPGSRGAASIETATRAVEDLGRVIDDCIDRIVALTAERDAANAEITRLHKALEVETEKVSTWKLQAMEYNTASVERARERDAARNQRDEACAEITRLNGDVEMILRQRDDARKQAEDRGRDLDWQNGMWADLARILGSDTRHPPALLKELEMRREPSEEMANELAKLRTERQLWHKDAEIRDRTETTIAAGTGPVAVPDDVPGDIKGLQNKVAEHSRKIGDLKDECRALREKIAAMAATLHAQGKAR